MKLIINSKYFNDISVSIMKLISLVDQVSFLSLTVFLYVVLPLFISYDLIFEESEMTSKQEVSWLVQHQVLCFQTFQFWSLYCPWWANYRIHWKRRFALCILLLAITAHCMFILFKVSHKRWSYLNKSTGTLLYQLSWLFSYRLRISTNPLPICLKRKR